MAASNSDRNYTERQAKTRKPGGDGTVPAPFVAGASIEQPPDPGEGMPIATVNQGFGLSLAGLNAVVITLVANVSATLSGAGTLYAWLWNYPLTMWVRAQYLDQPVTWNGVTAQRAMALSPLQNVSRLGGRLLFASNGLTLSGTTADFLLRMDGYIGHFGA